MGPHTARRGTSGIRQCKSRAKSTTNPVAWLTTFRRLRQWESEISGCVNDHPGFSTKGTAMNSTTVVILVAVAAVIVLAVLAIAANSKRNQRRHVKAEQIREDITTHMQKVDKREALADETAAKARAAQAEAEAKAAEAARLQEQAASHHDAVAMSREEIEERRRHADRLDPKTRVRDDAEQTDQKYDTYPDDRHDDAAAQEAAAREAARQEAQRG